MSYVERFGDYWNSLILEQKLAMGEQLDQAVVAYYPDVPILTFNHAANINVSEERIESLVNEVSEFFTSKGVPFVCFMVTPSTRPKSFASILKRQGFEVGIEESMMVFTGHNLEERERPQVDVKVLSEEDSGLFTDLLFTIFKMPREWNDGFNRLTLRRITSGVKCYIAYREGVPVGTCGLFSSEKTGEIFAVGTLEDHRGAGIATTLTHHAIRDSIKEGNDLHIIRAEKGGYPEGLYRRLDFEVDHTNSFLVNRFND